MILSLDECRSRVREIKVSHDCDCQSCRVVRAGEVTTTEFGEIVADAPASDTDTFIAEELELAAVLLAMWSKAVNDTGIVKIIEKGASGESTSQLNAALDQANYAVDSAFEDYGSQDEVNKILERTIEIGVLLWGSKAVYDAMFRSRKALLAGLTNHLRYFVNAYFSRIVMPSIQKIVLAVGTTAGLTTFSEPVLTALEDLVVSPGKYWRILANIEVSRGHHYGIMRGMQARGLRGYKFIAVMDDRTTRICKSMNGREFWLSDGINQLEILAGMDPSTIIESAPWPKSADEFKGLSATDLMTRGWSLPPLHNLCRSTIGPLY